MSVPVTAIATFKNNMALALQQTNSRLAQYAMQEAAKGELHEIVNLIGSSLPTRRTVRHGPTIVGETEHTRRWMPKTAAYEFVRLVEKADQLMAGIDLQGAYVMAGAATIQRSKDIAFLEGFYGTNLTGKNGLTQTAFGGNVVPVIAGAAAATGLNIAKLREGRRLLAASDVDLSAEEAYMGVTSEQVNDLQAQLEVISSDFNAQNAPVMRDGRLVKLFGFNFIEMEFGKASTVGPEIAALTLDSGNRRVPFWCKSGMAFGQWDMSMDIGPRRDLGNSIQVYADITCTASRTEEGKCGIILCAE